MGTGSRVHGTRARRQQSAASAGRGAAAGARGGFVLVVSGDELNARILERLLRENGHSAVRQVADARRAVTIACELQPELTVVDLDLPDRDGFIMLNELSRIAVSGPRLSILATTGDSDERVEAQARALGAGDVLTRPFETLQTRARVAHLLRSRSAGPEPRRPARPAGPAREHTMDQHS